MIMRLNRVCMRKFYINLIAPDEEETICMKCQSLFSGNNMKNLVNLLSAELLQGVVKIKAPTTTAADYILIFFFRENKASHFISLKNNSKKK